VLVRTWNLFHGNTVPPSRDNYLEEMVRLAVSDAPAVLCLQELPLWALPELEGWSGMTAFTQVAHRTPLGASLGRTVTEVHPGLLRSAVSGQGNAILLDRSLEPFDYHALVLNPRGFRSRERGLELGTRLAWAKERRALQVVRSDVQLHVAEPVDRDDAGAHLAGRHHRREGDRLVHRHEAHSVQSRRIGPAATTHHPLIGIMPVILVKLIIVHCGSGGLRLRRTRRAAARWACTGRP